MSTPSVSRRAVLAGAVGVALAGCTTPAHVGELSSLPTTAGEAEVLEALRGLDAAFAQADTDAFLTKAGPFTDTALWGRIHAGMHAVPLAERSLQISPNVLYRDMLRSHGELRLRVPARLRHRIDGVDALSTLQPVTVELVRLRPGAPLTISSVGLDSDQTQPWERAAVHATSSAHTVLQFRAEDADDARAAADDIERGVARAYGDVPALDPMPRQSVLWGWTEGGARPRLYGGKAMSEAIGICQRVAAQEAKHTSRITLMPNSDPAVVERTACHEAVHALAWTWGEGNEVGIPLLEGLATWAEYGFLDGWRRWNTAPSKPLLDEVVDTQMWRKDFYAGNVGAHYVIAAMWFLWLESRLGREAVWAMARDAYARNESAALRAAVGTEFAGTLPDFVAWARTY